MFLYLEVESFNVQILGNSVGDVMGRAQWVSSHL